MKILVVGATYMNNFGDMLFARLISEKLGTELEKRFYLTSDYCHNFVGGDNLSNFPVKEADALLYMPGGYLGDKNNPSLYTTYLWYKQYFPIGLHYVKKSKPIMILAVDAGPCKYFFMRRIIKKICKNATTLIVRNEDSKDFLIEKIGILPDNIIVTSDYAQTILNYPLPRLPLLESWIDSSKKSILLHVNECADARKVIIPALKKFYMSHSNEYQIVVASDQQCQHDEQVFEEVKEFAGNNAYFYKYGDPLELCTVIKSCNSVITYKLHVGIVAATYSKSVIPIPQHYKKVEKYYRQIGHSERVLPLKDATVDSVLNKIIKYSDTPIVLSDEIYKKAYQNNKFIDDFITNIQNGATHEK